MINTKSQAYKFVAEEKKSIREILNTFDYLVVNYDGINLANYRNQELMIKINSLEVKKYKQEKYCVKKIIEEEIKFLNKLKRFMLRIQDIIFNSTQRIGHNFYEHTDKILYQYELLTKEFEKNIRLYF